ncbi:PREDICTED: uncharacterized protein LOC104809707 isoform X2 [Tarenaya hassleriana]|uniref:uncharacterized protein LOC104809707 isoform X2 n=1 Tax=Tarenaya hassleriana TaxID=28532 RepID=UPI00053C503B|nr:PREDICTED: uncharacterized protein LOC104809707 isoform X2 [Tarenaya hassleriana]
MRMHSLYGHGHSQQAVNPRTCALIIQASVAPSLMGPMPRRSSQTLLPSTGLQNTQGLINQPSRTSFRYSALGRQQQYTHIQEIGGHLVETSSRNNNGDRGILGGQRGYKDQFEQGESSRRRRMVSQGESSRGAELPVASRPQDDSFGPTNPFDDRPTQNAVYDPIYEGVGLPVDPHLRLFGKRKPNRLRKEGG